MTESNSPTGRTPAEIVRELNELIAALDRRVPQVERLGEVALARAAATLRNEARRRIEEIERDAQGNSL